MIRAQRIVAAALAAGLLAALAPSGSVRGADAASLAILFGADVARAEVTQLFHGGADALFRDLIDNLFDGWVQARYGRLRQRRLTYDGSGENGEYKNPRITWGHD